MSPENSVQITARRTPGWYSGMLVDAALIAGRWLLRETRDSSFSIEGFVARHAPALNSRGALGLSCRLPAGSHLPQLGRNS